VPLKRIPPISFLITSAMLLAAPVLSVSGHGLTSPASGNFVGAPIPVGPPHVGALCGDNDAGWSEFFCMNTDGGTETSIMTGAVLSCAGNNVGVAAFNGNQTSRTFDTLSGYGCVNHNMGASGLFGGDGGIYVAAWVFMEADAGHAANSYQSFIRLATPAYAAELAQLGVNSTSGLCGPYGDLMFLGFDPVRAGGSCDTAFQGSHIAVGGWHYLAAWEHMSPGTTTGEFAFWVDGALTHDSSNVRASTAQSRTMPGWWDTGTFGGGSARFAQFGVRNYRPSTAQVLADSNWNSP